MRRISSFERDRGGKPREEIRASRRLEEKVLAQPGLNRPEYWASDEDGARVQAQHVSMPASPPARLGWTTVRSGTQNRCRRRGRLRLFGTTSHHITHPPGARMARERIVEGARDGIRAITHALSISSRARSFR